MNCSSVGNDEEIAQGGVGRTGLGVLPRLEVVGERRAVGEALEGGVEEAGVAHVVKACSNRARLAPLQHLVDFLLWIEAPLRNGKRGFLELTARRWCTLAPLWGF